MGIKWVVQCAIYATDAPPSEQDWLPPRDFSTLDQAAGYMFHMAHALVPDPARAVHPSVHFRVKTVYVEG